MIILPGRLYFKLPRIWEAGHFTVTDPSEALPLSPVPVKSNRGLEAGLPSFAPALARQADTSLPGSFALTYQRQNTPDCNS